MYLKELLAKMPDSTLICLEQHGDIIALCECKSIKESTDPSILTASEYSIEKIYAEAYDSRFGAVGITVILM